MMEDVLPMKVTLIALALAVVLPLAAVWTTQPSLAQTQTKFKSGIAGRVTDPNGAVIVGVNITLVGRTTKKPIYAKTNDSGEYTVDLVPELYDVEAESPGFKKAKRKYIPVYEQSRSFVDFMLVPKEN
jgi:hypothetical protein